RCTCKSCRKGAHYGYNCPSKVPIICNQNVEEFPKTLLSFHLTCYSGDENSFAYDSTPDFVKDSSNVFNPTSQPPMYSYEFCRNDAQYGHDCPPQVPFIYNPEPGPQETFQCQSMNYYEPNPCYDSNYSGFDNFQPSQPVIDHLNLQQRIIHPMIELRGTFQAWLQQRKDQVDENLNTIPEKESNEFIKSSVENLVPNPSESEDERKCDVPVCDDITTFFNLLFHADDDFSSCDDKLFSDKDIPKEIYSNPLFDEKIISIKIDPHHLNVELDLIESLLNQDSLIIFSSKIDSLPDEFVGELIFLKSIPPRIDEADCDPEEEIHIIEKLILKILMCIDSDYSDSEGDNLFPERLSHDLIPLPDIRDFSNVV
nr:hypothetical protein [Tanacetum cinerariifolium]GEZ91200.1 hypothetical protein [Tanacetum cinerariifolium]